VFTSKQNAEKTSRQYIKRRGFSKVWKTEDCILQVVLLTTFQQAKMVTVKIKVKTAICSQYFSWI